MYVEVWQGALALLAAWLVGGSMGILALACCVAAARQGEIGRGDKR